MGWTYLIDTDADTFVNVLNKLDETIAKGVDKSIRQGASAIRKSATKRLAADSPPLSGWAAYSWIEQDRSEGRNLQWGLGAERGGMRGYSAESGKRSRRSGVYVSYGVQVVQKSAQGAIYELMGGSSKGYRGTRLGGSQTMRANVNNKRGAGPYPRILYPAYYDGITDARNMIEAIVAEAERKASRG